eukprot:COSAG06_NODE_689_length_13068_cov_9.661269_11_plen_148_part_00
MNVQAKLARHAERSTLATVISTTPEWAATGRGCRSGRIRASRLRSNKGMWSGCCWTSQRTLSVYLNGVRRGVMVVPGMRDWNGAAACHYGGAVAPLAGPLRWAVDVEIGASVRIERRPPPRPAEEVAAAVAWNEANYEDKTATLDEF